MHWAVVLLGISIACKKQEEEPAPVAAPTTSSGSSSTKIKDTESEPGHAAAGAAVDAGSSVDAPLYGGNGQPARRDDNGRVRGPGGSLFMGRGPDCTDEIDHCMRDGVWFAVGNVQRGKLYRAKPVFEFESKWWTFDGEEYSDFSTAFKTKVATASDLRPGSTVVWLIEDNSGRKWLNSEHDALTSSRWEVGIVKSARGATFEVDGWNYPIPIETARAIVEQKKLH